MKSYNHLSYEDRKNIEDGLNENKSINQIAKELINPNTDEYIKHLKKISEKKEKEKSEQKIKRK